ncbi:MAG: hypothetical protein OEY74_02885 [Gammaproteobacteria bacterium]|nr:hypothetical protein [Gammaproteobacteria bacterium]
MSFLASPLGVLLILAVVAIAAITFQPARYVGIWREVAKFYETERRPSSTPYRDEEISLGLHELARIDAQLDDEGFWIVYNGPEPSKAPPCVLIPWDCIRFRQASDSRHHFQIRLKNPQELLVSPELGAALKRRSLRMPGAENKD